MKQIYVIRNIKNKKVYVGQSDNAFIRFRNHRSNAIYKRLKLPLYRAMEEIGVDNFYYEILENCENKDADARERYYIDKLDSIKNGYNIYEGGMGGTPITRYEINRIIELYNEGYGVVEIEKRTKHCRSTLIPILKCYFSNYENDCKERISNGVRNHLSKAVIQYDKKGNKIDEFYSIAEASRRTGIKEVCISSCCNRRVKSTHNYIFRFKNKEEK